MAFLGWAPTRQVPSWSEGLGQLFQGLGQMRQQQMFGQDVKDLGLSQQSQLPPGQQGPSLPFEPQSRQMQQMQAQGLMGQMFPQGSDYQIAYLADPETGKRTAYRVNRQTGEKYPLGPSPFSKEVAGYWEQDFTPPKAPTETPAGTKPPPSVTVGGKSVNYKTLKPGTEYTLYGITRVKGKR